MTQLENDKTKLVMCRTDDENLNMELRQKINNLNLEEDTLWANIGSLKALAQILGWWEVEGTHVAMVLGGSLPLIAIVAIVDLVMRYQGEIQMCLVAIRKLHFSFHVWIYRDILQGSLNHPTLKWYFTTSLKLPR